MTRRTLLGTAVALGAAPAAPLNSTVSRNDEYVGRLVAKQSSSGGIPDENGLPAAGPVSGLLNTGTASFLSPSSRYYKSPELFAKLKLGAHFLEGVQRASGNIDLQITNFDSPPDTGFVVHNVATAACLAMRAKDQELAALTRPFLKRAGAALATGGVHTPNHRWVICSALAQIHEIYPDPAYLRRIGQWLAEGIDMDDEGQYTERSTSIYNTVCDRAFVVMAAKLNRPELLEPVRRNLAAMMYLMHPNYEVVTEVSRRQDRGQRGDMGRYWFPLRYIANLDGNGGYATVADAFEATSGQLSALLEYPELNGPGPKRTPPPSDYVKEFPGLGIVRIRRGECSATIVKQNSGFFTLRNGDSVIQAVRFASPFFGHGQFLSPAISRVDGAWRLEQTLENGYYQPLDPPRRVGPEDWAAVRAERKRTEVCRQHQRVEIRETSKGFSLAFSAEGTDRIPVAIEISLRPGAHRGIKFGPPRAEHSYTRMRGAEAELPGESVYFTGFTPFRHTLDFELV
ncbi:MAG TPA: hypothetical protein VMZ52_02995 [Bryobacteraceae bacterium]|nr:hypothetical protein [Bryobacteraceae bacterium]